MAHFKIAMYTFFLNSEIWLIYIFKIYLNVLQESTSNSKGLYTVGDLILVTHRDGYSLGSVAEILPEDSYQIRLVSGKHFLTVTSDEISGVCNVLKITNYLSWFSSSLVSYLSVTYTFV